MIFDNAIPFQQLPESDADLKNFLNYNPWQKEYTARQNIPERNPNETDRAGWRGYDRVYSKYFRNIKNQKLNIIEIGIFHGYGIYAWQNYFKNSIIHGIDNDWKIDTIIQRKKLKDTHVLFSQARLYNLDSTKEDSWLQFYGKKFDIIIDDGDHHPAKQIATLKAAWPYLRNGGLYFIEDIGFRYGKDSLQDLSNYISSLKDKIEFLEIYSHDNAGLKIILKDKKYVSINRKRIKLDEPFNSTEFIVAIKKKME